MSFSEVKSILATRGLYLESEGSKFVVEGPDGATYECTSLHNVKVRFNLPFEPKPFICTAKRLAKRFEAQGYIGTLSTYALAGSAEYRALVGDICRYALECRQGGDIAEVAELAEIYREHGYCPDSQPAPDEGTFGY